MQSVNETAPGEHGGWPGARWTTTDGSPRRAASWQAGAFVAERVPWMADRSMHSGRRPCESIPRSRSGLPGRSTIHSARPGKAIAVVRLG